MSPDERPVFLTGFMGCGKSTVARLLATRVGWEIADTDRLVEEREGRSIDRLFRESGEGHFRRVEWEVLQGLEGRTCLVVATGGGLFLGASQRRFMKRHGTTCWLDAPWEVCLERVGEGEGRPLWLPQDPLAFRAFFEKRRAAYALADLRVPAGSLAPEVLAESLRLRLGLTPRRRKDD